jgi:hypothetical protein
MSNSPVKFIGAAVRALSGSGSGAIFPPGSLGADLGAIRGLGRKRGTRGRIQNLEDRVKTLEGSASQSNTAAAAAAAANVDASQPGTSTIDNSIGAVGGYGNFNPATMQMNNNAIGGDPIQGIQNVQSKIAAPGPLSPQKEGFMSEDLLDSF